MPSTRSSSTAWPIDSCTWSSIWPESRTRVVTSLGQSVAESSSTASVAVRSASSISPSFAMCSQPAAAMWPRNEFGYERRWSSPPEMAVASRPAPECRTVCSIALPSDEAKDVRTRYRSEEHTSELQSHHDLVCRLLLEKKKNLNQPRVVLNKKKKKLPTQ